MRIDNITICSIDAEEKEIMRRLLAYGIQPTGNKSIDMATLRQVEEQKAKTESVASNKFYTVSLSEMEKMIEKRSLLEFSPEELKQELQQVYVVSKP